MSQPQPISLRTLFWKEALPAGGFTTLLGWLPPLLAHYGLFSPLTNFYAWMVVWLAIVCVSLRFLTGQGPLQVAAFAWFRSFYMLWELYCLAGEKMSLGGVKKGEMFVAGVCTGVVVVGSYWGVTRLNHPGLREREAAAGMEGSGKV